MEKTFDISATHAQNIAECMRLLNKNFKGYKPFWISQDKSKPWFFIVDTEFKGYEYKIKLDIHRPECVEIQGTGHEV